LSEAVLSKLSGPNWGPASKQPPKQLVILCHGVGADGNDLIELAPFWAGGLPDAVFVAPHAPEPFDMAPVGRQWFSLGDLDPAELGAGVRRAAKVLDEFIDEQLAKYSLPPTAYALMGFSQGAMTALFTGLRRADAPRAILAFSGALIEPESLQAEMKNQAPVLLAHGEADQIVPVFRSRDAEAALRAVKIPVEALYVANLGHGIDDTVLDAGASFLKKSFAG
jgi:phospholipase/carboxylesterase